MIDNILKPGEFQNWNAIPISTKEEVLAPQATLRFSAKTTLLEKTQRIFNQSMFLIVGIKLLTFIPGVVATYSKLTGMVFTKMGVTNFLKIPAVTKIMTVATKIIVAIAFIQVIRKILAVAINHIIYIAALISLTQEQKEKIDALRWNSFEALTHAKFECRRIALNKSGFNYDAFTIEHQTTKGNGQWVIVAGGNGWIGEEALGLCAARFQKLGFNILFVNGAGVGRSSGPPTSYSIGAGQEAGLQLLEKSIAAKKILLYGTSLGGGAQAEAIINHEFQQNIHYMVWSDRSFDTLSNAASHMVTKLAKPLFFLLGIELDGVAGARRLEKLGITHLVTQNSHNPLKNCILSMNEIMEDEGSDGVIPIKASLLLGLKKAGIQKSERLKCYGGLNVNHNGELPHEIMVLVEADLQVFLA